MTMTVEEVLSDRNFKFVTRKKPMYDRIAELDEDSVFTDVLSTTMSIAFAIGYSVERYDSFSSGTAFLNLSSVPSELTEELIRLVIIRHPDLDTSSAILTRINEYAEYGIEELLRESNRVGRFNIDNFIDP